MKADSQWIWPDCVNGADQYGEFYQTFTYDSQKAELYISADSNYAVYVNGNLAANGQYPDYPHYKVYDVLDLSSLCQPGINHLSIVAWYYGISNYSYAKGHAALRFELWLNGTLSACSGEHTLARLSRTYRNGYVKTITGQLGLSYWYDLTKEDGWMTGAAEGFQPSAVVEQNPPLHLRPIPKCTIGKRCAAQLVRQENQRHFLFDLGQESVGYLCFSIRSSIKQKMMVAYGEHITDGGVRRLIGGRDFSVEYTLRAGENNHMNPFRRLGLRYLEVFCEAPAEIELMGICPVDYPVRRLEWNASNPLRQRIYDVCVRTLSLCMHDHYEDTPWREQGLYAMDSRNQMLCGYYAFAEYAFPRANLLLMSKDKRSDGLLSICFPSDDALTIPSFSLHYVTAVYEYTVHSGDLTLVQEVYPKLVDVLDAFICRMKGELLPNWTDQYHWNFYEWSDGLSGNLMKETLPCTDAALNCLFVLALQRMHILSEKLEIPDVYDRLAERVKTALRQLFFQNGSFCNSTLDSRRSVLVNALGILCGAVEGEEAKQLAERLTETSSGWTAPTLSMICFLYDALLKVDASKYRDFILEDIDTRYRKMLDAGATSFWETEEGESAFDQAGSLCHAWSSMPVYYYHLLNA